MNKMINITTKDYSITFETTNEITTLRVSNYKDYIKEDNKLNQVSIKIGKDDLESLTNKLITYKDL